jgi:hypothetical protein
MSDLHLEKASRERLEIEGFKPAPATIFRTKMVSER